METTTRPRNPRTLDQLVSERAVDAASCPLFGGSRDAQVVVGDERRLSPRRRPVKTLRFVGDVGESTASQRRASKRIAKLVKKLVKKLVV
jgi:hypothetical protein